MLKLFCGGHHTDNLFMQIIKEFSCKFKQNILMQIAAFEVKLGERKKKERKKKLLSYC